MSLWPTTTTASWWRREKSWVIGLWIRKGVGTSCTPSLRSLARHRSDQGREEARHQPASLHQALDHDVFLKGVRPVASGAEAVQGRDPQGAGKVSVGPAARALVRDLESQAPRQRARALVQPPAALVRLPH